MSDDAVNADVSADNAPSAALPKRKRGRPPLTDAEKKARADARREKTVREAPTAQRKPLPRDATKNYAMPDISAEKIKGLLLATHKIASIAGRVPELALGDDEAAAMAEAILAVLHEYNIPISGKAAALIGLAGTSAMVYLPRLVLIKERRGRERDDGVRVVNLKQPDSAA